MTVADIQSKTWGISVLGPGVIAQGLASLRQCIDIILRTSLGSDPLRPFFGSEVYKYTDAPMPVAIPNIKKAITEALGQWEQRIKVDKINHTLKDLGHVEFEIVYNVVDSDLMDSILFDLYNGGLTLLNTGNIILQALFPPGIATKRNNIFFVLNNTQVLPATPSTGFSNINETLAFCIANYGSYGRWYLLADRIVLYLIPGNYTQASLTLTVSSTFRYARDIFPLSPGDFYEVVFNPNNSGNLTSSGTLSTMADMLLFVRANWGNWGNWQIEPGPVVTGAFTDGFSDGFETDRPGYLLVLYSDIVTTISLSINII